MAEVYYIEGSDYTGKTTLIQNLSERIDKDGKTVLLLKEPNGYFRTQLLNSRKELSFFERRLLFLTCHMQTREIIARELDNYDYIIIDRCAIVSDMMHLGTECIHEMDMEICSKKLIWAYDSIREFHELTSKDFNSHLLLLYVGEKEFERRVSLRNADNQNNNDLKGMDFKKAIYNAYKDFIYNGNNIHSGIKDMFSTVHILDTEYGGSMEKADKVYYSIMRESK